jgi:hypothetical protein
MSEMENKYLDVIYEEIFGSFSEKEKEQISQYADTLEIDKEEEDED